MSDRPLRFEFVGESDPSLDPLYADACDMRFGGFRLWVHGRAHAARDGGFDDWVTVTARFDADGASVHTSGPDALTSQIHAFLTDLQSFKASLDGSVTFEPLDGRVSLVMSAGRSGRIAIRVEISPDPATQHHTFEETIDQTWLAPAIRGLRRVVERLPIER